MRYFSSASDCYYDTTADTLSYYIMVGDDVIYSGIAVKSPSKDTLSINVGKRIRDYLYIYMPDFSNYDGVVILHPEAVRLFDLYSNDGTLLEQYTMKMDDVKEWSGQCGSFSKPINKHADSRQKVFVSRVESGSTNTFELIAFYGLQISFSDDFSFPGSGGTFTIGYTANTDFDVYETCGWFSLSKTGTLSGNLVFSVDENASFDARACEFVAAQKDYVGEVCTEEGGQGIPFTVSQANGYYFHIDNVSVPRYGGDVQIPYQTNYTGEINFVPSEGITLVSVESGYIVVNVPWNYSHSTIIYRVDAYAAQGGKHLGTSILTQAASVEVTQADYLTIESMDTGTLKYTFEGAQKPHYNKNNQGWEWAESDTVICEVEPGDIVMLKAQHIDMHHIGIFTSGDTSASGVKTGKFNTYGNALSIKYYDSFSGITDGSNPPSRYLFDTMFSGSRGLVDASDLILPYLSLPSPQFAYEGAYTSMFSGCKSLKYPPALPATALTRNCYLGMFSGCESLITTPELPATDLRGAIYCYEYMFEGCVSLVEAPELPATYLASGCYYGMFSGCTSLISAPSVLPGEHCGVSGYTYNVADSSYAYMFAGCVSLVNAPSEIRIVRGTTSDTTLDHMFYNCTSLQTGPTFTNKLGYFKSTFEGCSSLISADMFPKEKFGTAPYAVPAGVFYRTFFGCTSLSVCPDFVYIPSTYHLPEFENTFEGCVSLVNGPTFYFPSGLYVSSDKAKFKRTFYGCSSLSRLGNMIDRNQYQTINDWVVGVSPTGTFIKKRNVSYETGDDGIPTGWNVIEQY